MSHGATVVDVRGCDHRVETDVHSYYNANRGTPISIIRKSKNPQGMALMQLHVCKSFTFSLHIFAQVSSREEVIQEVHLLLRYLYFTLDFHLILLNFRGRDYTLIPHTLSPRALRKNYQVVKL